MSDPVSAAARGHHSSTRLVWTDPALVPGTQPLPSPGMKSPSGLSLPAHPSSDFWASQSPGEHQSSLGPFGSALGSWGTVPSSPASAGDGPAPPRPDPHTRPQKPVLALKPEPDWCRQRRGWERLRCSPRCRLSPLPPPPPGPLARFSSVPASPESGQSLFKGWKAAPCDAPAPAGRGQRLREPSGAGHRGPSAAPAAAASPVPAGFSRPPPSMSPALPCGGTALPLRR